MAQASRLSFATSLGAAPASLSAPKSVRSVIVPHVASAVVHARAQQQHQDQRRLAVKAAALYGAGGVLIGAEGSARAVDAESIVDTLNKVEDFVGKATAASGDALSLVKDVLSKVVQTAKPIVDAAAPVVSEATQSALKVASPVAADLAKQAEKLLSESGVDTKSISDAAKTAASVAGGVTSSTEKAITAVSPFATSTLETLASQDPVVLAAASGALVLFYVSLPGIISLAASSLRGYAGDLTAAQTLDLLTKSNYVLVDVRTEAQKGRSGVPSLPRNSRKKLVSVPVEEVPNKLRGQLRDARKVEAELTALKIAALKRFGKGSNIVILDTNGSVSKLVARFLSSLGFGNVYSVIDGLDGSRGWVQSQLATDSFNTSFAEILSPSRTIPRNQEETPAIRRGFLLSSGSDE